MYTLRLKINKKLAHSIFEMHCLF